MTPVNATRSISFTKEREVPMEKRIQSIQRAINILNCYNEEYPNLSLSQISEQLDLNINTVRGIVNTLEANGLLTHNASDNTYSLGLYFVLKSNLIYETRHLESFAEITTPYLQEISTNYSTFSSVQVVSQSNIFMIKTMQPPSSYYRIMAQLYSSLPYHCTSSGKLYLQYLSKDNLKSALANMNFEQYTPNTISNREELMDELQKQKERLYSLEKDERTIGISSIAAPILHSNRRLIGTISVTAPTQSILDQQEDIARDLIHAGKDIAMKVLDGSIAVTV